LIDPFKGDFFSSTFGATGCGQGVAVETDPKLGMVSFTASLFYDRQMTVK